MQDGTSMPLWTIELDDGVLSIEFDAPIDRWSEMFLSANEAQMLIDGLTQALMYMNDKILTEARRNLPISMPGNDVMPGVDWVVDGS